MFLEISEGWFVNLAHIEALAVRSDGTGVLRMSPYNVAGVDLTPAETSRLVSAIRADMFQWAMKKDEPPLAPRT